MCGFDKARPQFRHITSSLAVIPQNTQFIHRVINNCAQMTPFDKGIMNRESATSEGQSALSSPRSAKCEVRSAKCKVRGAKCKVRGAKCARRFIDHPVALWYNGGVMDVV